MENLGIPEIMVIKKKKTHNIIKIEHWFYHISHLDRDIKYLKECKICNLRDLKVQGKEPHAGK